MTELGVLLIHGTMGHSQEFEALEARLRQAGYLTLAVDLPAHGESPNQTMGQVSADEIIDHCLDAYGLLVAQCQQVVVVGHSLGGICSLILGAHHPPKLAAVVALSAPYQYAYSVNYTYGLLGVPVRRLFKAVRFLPQYNTGLKKPRFRPWWFPRLVQETQYILGKLQAVLPQIQAPVYLAHATHDLIIPYAEMSKIHQALTQSAQVTTLTLDACGHQIFPGTPEEARVTAWLLEILATVHAKNRLQSQTV